ncbi:hypothetical protein H5410_006745 [Solanum commersonii]|uniref:Uncharacterized protein n=1 Tax=Solanum commersonii TaxID=4109 RepID=A0A9J6AC73_SOLCO|nr:hypothetical protein H5410_006745 [Solanum commersonii]
MCPSQDGSNEFTSDKFQEIIPSSSASLASGTSIPLGVVGFDASGAAVCATAATGCFSAFGGAILEVLVGFWSSLKWDSVSTTISLSSATCLLSSKSHWLFPQHVELLLHVCQLGRDLEDQPHE